MFGDLVEDVSEDCVDDDTSIYVKNVVKALQLGSGEVLLAVAWVTEEGRMYHEMFPGVLGLDVKYGTNNERRPLLRFVGRTGNNRNMTVMNCYMPSEQQYAYAWAVNTALKHCLDEDALSQTSIIPSYEDNVQLTSLFSAVNSRTILGPNAMIRLCKWHKVSLCLVMYLRIYAYTHIRAMLHPSLTNALHVSCISLFEGKSELPTESQGIGSIRCRLCIY